MSALSTFARTGLLTAGLALAATLALGQSEMARAEETGLGNFLKIGIGPTAENVTIDTGFASYAMK